MLGRVTQPCIAGSIAATEEDEGQSLLENRSQTSFLEETRRRERWIGKTYSG